MADLHSPAVSVCIPTYKRPALLERAVASVFAQTYQDWELVISDDEDPAGETWEYLRELPKQDSRVRVMRNPAPHGQVPNINSTFRQARGTWLKPLHDDDVLRPECLETLLLSTRELPSVAIVSCLADRYYRGALVRARMPRVSAPLELVPQRYIHLGMYLQDCSMGVPTGVMVHRKAIEQGALFEDVPGVTLSVDALWNCSVSRHGNLLFVNKVLVEYHQDAETITASGRAGQLDAEYPILLRRELECIDSSLKPPPLTAALALVGCLRAISYIKSGKIGEAFRLHRCVRHPHALVLFARWVLAQIFPGRFHVAPRIPVSQGNQDSRASEGPL